MEFAEIFPLFKGGPCLVWSPHRFSDWKWESILNFRISKHSISEFLPQHKKSFFIKTEIFSYIPTENIFRFLPFRNRNLKLKPDLSLLSSIRQPARNSFSFAANKSQAEL